MPNLKIPLDSSRAAGHDVAADAVGDELGSCGYIVPNQGRSSATHIRYIATLFGATEGFIPLVRHDHPFNRYYASCRSST